MIWRTPFLLLSALLSLTSCATEPGTSPKPLRPQNIHVMMVNPDDLLKNGLGGLTITATINSPDGCFIMVPIPSGADDWNAFRYWFHELRHCNGETHDKNGVWNK